MATFFMFGRYSVESVKGISAERTKQATSVIEKHGGKLQSFHALLGDQDLCLIVDFPDIETATRASIGLTKLTGISFSTSPAIDVSEFDKLAAEA